MKTAWWLTMTGYFGLLLLLLAWHAVLLPPHSIPVALVLLVLVVPLLFPLRGLLHGKPYTFAWTSFLALFYFTLGVGNAWADSQARWLGGLEILFSVMLYTGCLLYVRLEKKQRQQQ